MRIIRDLNELKAPLPKAVLTIGNFDGVHLGHREIFRRVVAKSRSIGGTAVVLTFVPHPLKVLAPERAPRLINSYTEKETLIEASSIDVLVCEPFTGEFAKLTAEQFVEDILVRKIGVAHIIVGYDYAFGRQRKGDIAFLRRKGRELGFMVEALEPIVTEGAAYSSTRIREMLMAGEVEEVVKLLGRQYSIQGEVVHGAARGKQLGFPTANLAPDKDLLTKPGVYAVKVRHEDAWFDGVVNIGCNPTFGNEALSVEVHILDFDQEVYRETLRLYFVARLRDERPFSSVDELKRAIAADIEKARDLLGKSRVIEYREYLRGPGYAEESEGEER